MTERKKTPPISVYTDADTKARIFEAAATDRRSASRWLELLAVRYLDGELIDAPAPDPAIPRTPSPHHGRSPFFSSGG